MGNSYRRYEILLPLKLNDGRQVPDALIATTLMELQTQFGVISAETQTIQGTWTHLGRVYRDDLVRVFVDVEDKPAARTFFEASKSN